LLAELAQPLHAARLSLVQSIVFFERLQQTHTRLQSMSVPALRQVNAMRGPLVYFGRRLQLERIMLRSEKAGIGTGIDHAIVPDRPRNRHTARHVARRLEIGNDTAERGEIAAVPLVPRHCQRVVDLAGQRVIDADLVLIARMRVRANDRHLAGVLRNLRQLVADLNAGDGGTRRAELTLDPIGRVELGIKRFLLRRTAP
jgi:hypothetical protein